MTKRIRFMSDVALSLRLASTNAEFFLREFSFSRTQFTPPGATEVELADHVVCFDDHLLVYQFKERQGPTNQAHAEERWFDRNVARKATRQIRDTLALLEANDICLDNEHGHAVKLPRGLQGLKVAKLVVYQPGSSLPIARMLRKGHQSSTAGFVHFLPANDYRRILATLVTLPEITDFLAYRERVCRQFPLDVERVSEKAIVGHYLLGDEERAPSWADEGRVDALDERLKDFEIFGVLQNFRAKTEAGHSMRTDGKPNATTDYYAILKEMVRLDRNDLPAFKQRFMWAWSECGDDVQQPSIFASRSTGCAFVFVPAPPFPPDRISKALNNFTVGCKYHLKTDRCVGILLRRDGEHRLIDWMYLASPWEPDPDLEDLLQKSNPFRPTSERLVPRYTFNS